MISFAIEVAKSSKLFDKVIVSTEIAFHILSTRNVMPFALFVNDSTCFISGSSLT